MSSIANYNKTIDKLMLAYIMDPDNDLITCHMTSELALTSLLGQVNNSHLTFAVIDWKCLGIGYDQR